MLDVSMRKQKSDIISWKQDMNTDYMTLLLYIKQTHSLSAQMLGPKTGSFMLTLSTMKCCRMARFGIYSLSKTKRSQFDTKAQIHPSRIKSFFMKCVDPSIYPSRVAKNMLLCWHRFAVFCCSETQCDAQSPFRTWRRCEIPKSSLSWIHSELDMPKVSIWASHAAAGTI